MCAGLGTRLRPLTLDTPKPMMKISNKPILLNTIDILKQADVKDIVINLHSHPEVIENYFKDGTDFGVKIKYSFEKKLMGTAGGLSVVRKYFMDDTFVIMSGDGLVDIDLKEAIKFHKSKKSIATIVLKRYDTKLKYGVVFSDNKTHKITKFVEKPEIKDIYENRVNTGIYILEPQIFDFIPEDKFYDFGNNVWPELMKNDIPVYAYEMHGYWCDIGDLDAYKIAQKDVLDKKLTLSHSFYQAENEKDQKVFFEEPVSIGENNKFDENVSIKKYSVLGNNCKVKANVIIENSILGNNVEIGENTHLSNCIVMDNAIVGENMFVNNGIFINKNKKLNLR
jgi:mannose-1-phosphate guanylyltransferase/phosphomannomutase